MSRELETEMLYAEKKNPSNRVSLCPLEFDDDTSSSHSALLDLL